MANLICNQQEKCGNDQRKFYSNLNLRPFGFSKQFFLNLISSSWKLS